MVASKFLLASILLAAGATASNYRRDGYNPIDIIASGVKSGMINARQQVESMTRGIQANDGHPTANALKAFITGLDGQIDNGIGLVANLLSPLTFGASNAIEGAILGPFFQSVTDGAEVAISNIIGNPIDAVLGSSIESLSNSLSKMIVQGNQLGVDKKIISNLATTQQRMFALVPKKQATKAQPQQKNHRRALAVLDGVQTSVDAARQSIDTLVSQLPKSGSTSPAAIAAIIDRIDAQIDGAVGNVNNLLAPYTTGLTTAVSDTLLGSFLQSVTNSANAVISNIGVGGVDAALYPSLENLSKSIQNAADFAGKYNLSDRQTQLININHRIHLLIKQ